MKQHQPQMPAKSHTNYRPKGRVIRLNSAAWKRLRAHVLADEPLCRHCYDDYGRLTRATDVDHINNDGDDNRRENLQPLCHECHSRKTRAEMSGREVRKVYGCDVNGIPLDPNHHWNAEITSNRSDEDRSPSQTHAVEVEEFR